MVAQDSGEDSDAYVMRVYNQMIEKEKSKNESSKSGHKNSSINNSRGKTKHSNSKTTRKEEVLEVLEEDNESINSGKTITELQEENERLKTLVDQLKNESQNVINKASNLKQKDKTSVLQILELLKLNAYLVSHLPNADRILEEYLLTKPRTNRWTTPHTSKGSNDIISSTSKGPKSSVNVNPISNYFKSVRSESNGSNVRKNSSSNSDSDDKPLSDRYSSKKGSSDNFTKIRSKENSKRRERVDRSYDDLSDNEKSSNESKGDKRRKTNLETTRRVSPRKANQNASKSAAEDSSDEKNKSMVSTKHLKRSESKTRESVDKNSTEKPKPKRRRRREEEPKGHFPCTFDPKQCDEIMDTKENFDFHMSGHYDAKYVCPFCAYTGPTIQIIKRHMNKERETAIQEAEEGKKLNEDKRAHKEVKIYQCFGCKVCHKIHGKLEKRCKCIDEDSDNECDFRHDMDYEFKDHLKSRHFMEKFKSVKDSDERKQKIRSVTDKFVDELYFENKAKKVHLIEELIESVLIEPKNKSDDNTNDDNKKDDNKRDDNKKVSKRTETVRPDVSDSDSDWD